MWTAKFNKMSTNHRFWRANWKSHKPYLHLLRQIAKSRPPCSHITPAFLRNYFYRLTKYFYEFWAISCGLFHGWTLLSYHWDSYCVTYLPMNLVIAYSFIYKTQDLGRIPFLGPSPPFWKGRASHQNMCLDYFSGFQSWSGLKLIGPFIVARIRLKYSIYKQ